MSAAPPRPQPAPPRARAAGPAMVNDILGYSRSQRSTPSAPAPSSDDDDDPAPAPPPRREAPTRLDPARPDPPGTDLCDGQRWRRFVHGLGADEQLTVLRGMLARSGFLSTEGDVIHVGFFSTVTLQNAEAELDEPAFQSAARAYFGRDVTLGCTTDATGASGRSLAEELDRIRAERTASLRADALAHPAVTATQNVFPGATVAGEPRIPAIEEISDVW